MRVRVTEKKTEKRVLYYMTLRENTNHTAGFHIPESSFIAARLLVVGQLTE